MLLFFAGSFAYAQDPLGPVTTEQSTFQKRLQWYAKITYTDPWRPVWLVGEVTANDFLSDGGIDKWGSGLSGLGKSLAAVYGQRVVANTAELFIGQLVGDDARYRPSGQKGVTRRVSYATIHAFTAQARNGNTRPAYSRCIAVTTGALVANQWLPQPKTGADLTRTLVFGITDKIQNDLLTEFSPDLKRFGSKIWSRIHHCRPPCGTAPVLGSGTPVNSP
jgi:hypothetical protein